MGYFKKGDAVFHKDEPKTKLIVTSAFDDFIFVLNSKTRHTHRTNANDLRWFPTKKERLIVYESKHLLQDI